MANTENEHKNNVFCLICRDRENLLSMYNALNNSDYMDADALSVVTLESAVLLKMHNDAAFIFNQRLHLYEQQASVNPNMPLRDLYYVAEEYKKLVAAKKLYGKALLKIPAPKFITFYNGTEEQPEETELKLSDMYEVPEEKPELELIVRQININEGYNDKILEKCICLKGYMIFVNKVRHKMENGMDVVRAVTEAVEECIAEGVLAEFFVQHRNEVVEMGVLEYNQEEHDQVLRDESYMEGHEAGLAEGHEAGLLRGKSESIIKLLTLNWEITDEIKDKILNISDLQQLDKLLESAVSAESYKEFLKLLE